MLLEGMRNKRFLILIFAVFAGVLYAFPQTTDSVSLSKDLENNYKQKEEYQKELKEVSKDTTSLKITSFTPHFQDKYRNDEDFDYSNQIGGKTFWEKLKERIRKLLSILFGWDKDYKIGNATNIAFYVLSGIIILVVIYFIVRFIISHEGKWFFLRKNEEIVIDVNDLEQLIQYADFEKMISETEKQGDTRQSIRLYYLWLLRTLNEKKIIEWNIQKTNADYMNEIKIGEVKNHFTYLSYLFNYIWYGEFSITDTDYVNAKNAFLTYLKRNGK